MKETLVDNQCLETNRLHTIIVQLYRLDKPEYRFARLIHPLSQVGSFSKIC